MRKFIMFITGIISFCLCIILLCVHITTFSLINVKKFVSRNNITHIIEKANIKDIMDVAFEKQDIMGNIYKEADKVNISNEKVDEVINGTTIKSFLSEFLYGRINGMITGNNFVMSSTTIEDYIDDLAVEIQDKTDYQINDELIKEAKTLVNENIDLYQESFLEEEQSLYENIKLIFTLKAIIYLFASMVVIVLLLMLLRFSFYKWAMWTGVTTLISSIIIIFTGLFVNAFTSILSFDESIESIITILSEFNITKTIGISLIISGLIGIVLGILQIVLYNLGKSSNKKKHIGDEINDDFKDALV